MSAMMSSGTRGRPLRNEKMSSLDADVTQDDHTEMSSEETKKQSVVPSAWETLCKWGIFYLHIDPAVKIGYYIITLLLFSLIKESMEVPHFEVLTGKHSVLNQAFVKNGWGITCAVFTFYQLASVALHTKWKAGLKQLFVRAAVTTFFFFVWCVVIFQLLEKYTEACTHKGIRKNLTKRECFKRDSHVYHSFDISGHSFLLTYCTLIMMEESREILHFLSLARHLRGVPEGSPSEASSPEFDEKETKSLKRRFNVVSPLVVIGFLGVSMLCLLWDFMLIVTTIYYHSFLEKAIGTILAVSMWYVLYRGLLLCIFKHNSFHS